MQTVEALQTWIDNALKQGLIAVDTETTSLDQTRADWLVYRFAVKKAVLVISLSGTSHLGLWPLWTSWNKLSRESEKPPQIPLQTVLDMLKPVLTDPSVLKVGHNIKYDIVVLARYGVPVSPVDDTMLLSYVLEGGKHGHGMDDLADLYLGHTTIKFKEVTGTGKSQITFDQVPLEKALDYAARRRCHNLAFASAPQASSPWRTFDHRV